MKPAGGAPVLLDQIRGGLVGIKNEQEQEKANDAVERVMQDVDNGLRREENKGAVVVVVFKRNRFNEIDLFRFAHFRLVAGQTLAQAKADYFKQMSANPIAYDTALNDFEYFEYRYFWIPPSDSEELVQSWIGHERIRDWSDEWNDYFKQIGMRMLPKMFTENE